MIYAREIQVGIYTRERVTRNYKSIIISRVISKAKRILRKKSEPKPRLNWKSSVSLATRKNQYAELNRFGLNPPRNWIPRNLMSVIKRASLREAVDYEIERAETNSRLSIFIHEQLESRAYKYHSNNQEVVTDYPKTIAPLVINPSHKSIAVLRVLTLTK